MNNYRIIDDDSILLHIPIEEKLVSVKTVPSAENETERLEKAVNRSVDVNQSALPPVIKYIEK